MKILYVEASAGAVVGGSLTGLLHLVAGLDRQRFQPVLVLYEAKPMIPALVASGTPVHVVHRRKLPKQHGLQGTRGYQAAKGRRLPATVLANARRLLSFLVETLPSTLRLLPIFRRESPDIVHVCNGFRGNLDAIVAARLCGIPCVVHNKGFDKLSFLERAASGGVAAALSMTRAIQAHCRQGGLEPRRWMVSYDGVDPASFVLRQDREAVRAALGVPADAPVVGVVGNIQEWKGQVVLVEAMALLRERFPKLRAWIVGGVHASGAAYAEKLRRRIGELGLDDRILLTGAREDVPDLMRAMDVVVHTSVRGEPFGRVIIEAMTVGRPVVATRAGGVPEFVRDGVDGLLAEPGDAEDLASRLAALLGDAEFYARLAEGARLAGCRFTIERHVAEVTDLYERIRDGRPAAEGWAP